MTAPAPAPRAQDRALFGLGRWGWALLAVGLALRIGYSAYALRGGLVQTFADGYEWIAVNLIEHRGYSGLDGQAVPTAAREPGFVLLIALVYELFGKRPLLLLAVQSALNVGVCVLLARCAERLSSRAAGRAALVIGLFYPYFIFYCAYFYRETFLTTVVTAAWLLAGAVWRKPSAALAAAAGLAWGLCAATMSTFLLVSPVVGAAVAWRLAVKARAAVPAAIFCAALALPPGLWTLRNYAVFGRLIPGSTLGGYNLYTSLIVPEEDRGTEHELAVERGDALWPKLIGMSSLLTDDGRQQEAFLAAAKDYIRAHPRRFILHVLKQAGKLWRPYPYERKYAHSYALIRLLSLLSDGWLIPLGLWGLWRLRRRGPEPGLAGLLLLSTTAAYALISAIVRYRLPLMGPLIVGAAVLLAERLTPGGVVPPPGKS